MNFKMDILVISKFNVFLVFFFLFHSDMKAIDFVVNYDSLNRITNVTYASGGSISYEYDKSGNRIRKIILAPNLSPIADNDNVQRPRDSAVKLDQLKMLDNDSDSDGDPLTIISVESPTLNGATVIFGEGVVVYTPPPGFNDPDTFTYTISDGRGGESTATVFVTVRPPDNGQAKNSFPIEFLSEPPRARVRFSTAPATEFIIEMSTELEPANWNPIGTATSGLNGFLIFEDTSPCSGG